MYNDKIIITYNFTSLTPIKTRDTMLKEVEDVECEINKQLDTAIKKMVMFRIKILAFRQWESHSNSNVGVRFFYFCIKGVAGLVVPHSKDRIYSNSLLNPRKEMNLEIFVNDSKNSLYFIIFILSSQ